MATMYQEIANAARLLQSDKIARANWRIEGQISPQTKQAIKDFQFQAKKSFQSLNSVKNFYVKSFFYDTVKECLILYTRIMGNDVSITCKPIDCQHWIFETQSGKVSYSIRRLLTACLAYWIPSENSTYNHKAINLMPQWRQQQ